MNTGKSPGSDGLTVDFYLRFWGILEPAITACFRAALLTGRLTSEQRRGEITLIPKKDLDRSNIANWRPIALLNTDYKILTKAYAIRLKSCLGEVIHSGQSGFMVGRYIGINVRTIADIVRYAELSRTSAWLLGCDFNKAFDYVRWDLILRALSWLALAKTS